MQVVTLCTGTKYLREYVDKLYKGLARHTTRPFNFECVTESKYPGWWGKMEQLAPKDRTLLLDLDLVITGNVDFLFEYEGQFCAWKDPWFNGLNSSVLSMAPGVGAAMRATFEHKAEYYMRTFQSDQEVMSEFIKPDYWPAGLVQSYKADGLTKGPKNARIVVFHGKPKPHEIKDGWVKEQWR